MRIFLAILPLLLILVGLAVLLSFVSPWAPVLLLASLLLQAPVIYLIAKFTYDSAYTERLYARKLAFEKDNDADIFLQKEKEETSSFGYRLLSRKNKMQNCLIQAEMLVKLCRFSEADALLCSINTSHLRHEDAARFTLCKNACTEQEATEP